MGKRLEADKGSQLMLTDSHHKKTESGTFMGKVLENRTGFSSYNMNRLRRLLHGLPENKLELFHTVPLLLHMNSPDLPGFIDHPQAPHGIYLFFDSGFWNLAKQEGRVETKGLRPLALKKYYIRGLYLMGSTGTVGQTEYSDFNYIVVIDDSALNPQKKEFLAQKLDVIKMWGKEKYDQNLSFLVINLSQIQDNSGVWLNEKNIKITSESFLKEEFYRTFILIAGQIPYWAVVPAGLDDDRYRSWISTVLRLSGDNLMANDYIDLGNISFTKNEECVYGLFKQICEANVDPVKSLLKASLLVYHYFFQDKDGVLCNSIKSGFFKNRLDNYQDPYMLALEKAIKFYGNMADRDGLDLIRQSIFLKLSGHPIASPLDEKSVKRQTLMRYVNAWSWDYDQIDRMENYRLWPEEEKRQFEERIKQKLIYLFDLIKQAREKVVFPDDKEAGDLVEMENRISGRFKETPGKLPYCSTFLRARAKSFPLSIINQSDNSGGPGRWVIYDCPHNENTMQDSSADFIASEPVRVLGWMILNGLYSGGPSSVIFNHKLDTALIARAEHLLEEMIDFFHGAPDDDMLTGPAWRKIFVALDSGFDADDMIFNSVDFLVQNTWGELFFYSFDLSHIENNLLKCYEIGKQVRGYLEDNASEMCEYRLYFAREPNDATITRTISDFIRSKLE